MFRHGFLSKGAKMILPKDIADAVENMRRIGADTQRWEVKEAAHDLPKSLPETISSFSNLHGGMIVLGLSEKEGFRPVRDFETDRIYAQMQTIGDKMTPLVRMEVGRVPFEGSILVAAQVSELPRDQKPCFISARGQYEGSFVRSGDGDRHLTPYEVDRLLEGRRQPQYDLEPVEAASMDDLDETVLRSIVSRAREIFPRVFSKLSDEIILIQLGVLVRIEDRLCPTLAGLMCAGTLPQRFFPRLEAIFTLYSGTTKGDGPERRYVTTREIGGSIPDMMVEILNFVQTYMKTAGVVDGALRRDVPDYPMGAVREAAANALQHRDYSLDGRSTPVEVNMYADRLEITNPGGLYGATTVESLGREGISSTRNEFLSRLLAYVPFQNGYVVENKGTGFMVIDHLLSRASMPPPLVQNSLTFFRLTFKQAQTSKAQPPKEAEGFVPPPTAQKHARGNIDAEILKALAGVESMSPKELAEKFGLTRTYISVRLRKLAASGAIEPTEARQSPKQRYRLAKRSN